MPITKTIHEVANSIEAIFDGRVVILLEHDYSREIEHA
jgi:hypothetical protein